MTKYIGSLLVALLCLLSGCVKNKFEITFEFPESFDATYTLTYYASDKRTGFWIEQVAVISHGKGSVEGMTRNPTIVLLRRGSGMPDLPIYVERGDRIVIKGADNNVLSWSVSGNKIDAKLDKWLHDNNADLLAGKIQECVRRYVKANPGEPLAAMLLACMYDRREDPKGFAELSDMLEGEALESPVSALYPPAIATSDGAGPVVIEQPLIFKRSLEMDTLRTGKAPVIIYFYNSNVVSRANDLRLLKELCGEYPDSASRTVVDVSLETDSLNWLASLRADSLRHTLRAWMPVGFADSTAIYLGVTRIPFWIVADKSGRIVYRGDNSQQALSSYKPLIKK